MNVNIDNITEKCFEVNSFITKLVSKQLLSVSWYDFVVSFSDLGFDIVKSSDGDDRDGVLMFKKKLFDSNYKYFTDNMGYVNFNMMEEQGLL